MRTRRNAGDNGYRSAEDYANEGRGYERRDNYVDVNRYERDDVDYRGQRNAQNNSSNDGLPQERGRERNSYDNGSNVNNRSSRQRFGSTSKTARNGASGNSSSSRKSSALLDKFFMDMLKDIYWAEKHLVTALPEMQRAATTDELEDAFEDHLLATQKHVSRLEKVFKLLNKDPETKKCEAMNGLVEEARSIIKETKDGTMTRDVGLIIGAQKIEHYEIATYGSMVQLARTMGREDIANLLEKTLWDEEDTDQRLTQIAESSVNPMADEEDSDVESSNDHKYAASTASMA